MTIYNVTTNYKIIMVDGDTPTIASSSLKGSDFIKSVLKGIAWAETRGRRDAYTAQGALVTEGRYKGEKAQGKYQIMPTNWKQWSEQAGLGSNAPMTPENQEIVAAHHARALQLLFGNNADLISGAWYTGERNIQKLIAGDTSRLNVRDVSKTTSISQYMEIAKAGRKR